MNSLHLKIQRELSHPYLQPEASSVKRAKSKSIQPSKFKFYQVSKQLAKLDDKLLKINPLVDFVPNDQRIKDTFQQYLQGNFSPQEMVFTINFPKQISKLGQETDSVQKFVIQKCRLKGLNLDSDLPPIPNIAKERSRKNIFINDKVKKRKSMIEKSQGYWNKLRAVIMKNIELRKKLKATFQQQKGEDTSPSTNKSKKLKNISLVFVQKGYSLPQLNYDISRDKFRKNADSFIKLHAEPFSPKFRQRLIQSDQEYNRVLLNYLQKVPRYNEWLKNKQKVLTQQVEDPLKLTKHIIEQQQTFLAKFQYLQSNNQEKGIKKDIKIHDRKLNYLSQRKNLSQNNSQEKIDTSDNTSNASITEGKLDQMYKVSIGIKDKLKKTQEESTTQYNDRQIKSFLKLETLNKQIRKVNNIKLSYRF